MSFSTTFCRNITMISYHTKNPLLTGTFITAYSVRTATGRRVGILQRVVCVSSWSLLELVSNKVGNFACNWLWGVKCIWSLWKLWGLPRSNHKEMVVSVGRFQFLFLVHVPGVNIWRPPHQLSPFLIIVEPFQDRFDWFRLCQLIWWNCPSQYLV